MSEKEKKQIRELTKLLMQLDKESLLLIDSGAKLLLARQKLEKQNTAQEGKLVAKERDYKKEYKDYHSKPEQKKNRAARNKARREMGLKVGDPREVDHKKPLSKGGSNAKSNLRVVSRTTNRKKGNKLTNL